MPEMERFAGFSPKTVKFLTTLKTHNNREWFSRNKATYTTHVLEPAQAFVTAMGMRLREIAPNIIFAPGLNRSIFRIYRDTRFSPDKSPYKTHLGIFFWEGIRPRMECPGFYFHLEPPHLMLGGGLYRFPRPRLEMYRSAVVHPEYGAELSEIVSGIQRLEGYWLGGKHYKRVPPGFDTAHPQAALLLHNGLYAGTENPIPDVLYSPRLLDYCMERFTPLIRLHRWLVDFNARLY
jgi:uncharacterized protein (TIGR02453 family)